MKDCQFNYTGAATSSGLLNSWTWHKDCISVIFTDTSFSVNVFKGGYASGEQPGKFIQDAILELCYRVSLFIVTKYLLYKDQKESRG